MTSKLELDTADMPGQAVDRGFELFFDMSRKSYDNALDQVYPKETRLWFAGRGFAYSLAAEFFADYISEEKKAEVVLMRETFEDAWGKLR